MSLTRTQVLVVAVSSLLLSPTAVLAASPSQAAPAAAARAPMAPELSETRRLDERRSLVVGERFYQMGAEDGRYPATGFHTRGEMGGFWTPPIKLLDGLWFKVGDDWLGGPDEAATSYTSGWGYQRMAFGSHGGVDVSRVDFVPGKLRAGVVGLHLTSPTATTVPLQVDAHSELMKVYPWGETTPSQTRYNLGDTGKVRQGALVFQERGTPPVRNAERHDYAAAVGSNLTPTATALGRAHRGPQAPATICPASGPDAPEQPDYCDDTEYGEGTGGSLTYEVDVPAGGTTVWFAVGGSEDGAKAARASMASALDDPEAALQRVVAKRKALDAQTSVDLPGDPLLEQSIAWSKQNLAKSVQQSRDLRVRITNAGKKYPAPVGTVRKATWIGAGWPDYPWLFATDGEYTAFAAVAAGQFGPIEKHIKALRDVSLVANGRSGKIVHEVTPDGQVYFGANNDPGNTDETAKFPSAVALIWRWTGDDRFRDAMYPTSVRAMRYIFRELDADHDLWPEGLGNVEREGMGEEKLDNAVYTIRGLRDLADLADSKGDRATKRWATARAKAMQQRFDDTWWFGPAADQYADSLDDPGNEKVFQRHWIGATPVEAELRMPDGSTRPLAPRGHANQLVEEREGPCYTDEFGMYHTGTGATTADGGNKGATCDDATSSVQSERSIFTLNTSIIAVAEAALGRMAADQLQRYTTANARVQLDPDVWEIPGDMPEISPSPDFGANIDKKFTERSSALQAWGTYGVLWPVVRYELGVSPDMGRNRVSVVPQLPEGQDRMAVRKLRLGGRAIDVEASRDGAELWTTVSHSGSIRVTIGTVLPDGATADDVASVRLNGDEVPYDVVSTARGDEVRVRGNRCCAGGAELVVTLAG